jgi:hypothetical protein
VYQADLHRCGHPKSRAMHPDMAGEFEVDDSITCYACAAEDEYRKAHKDIPAGAVLRVVDGAPERVLEPWDPDDERPARDGDDVPDESDLLG